MLISLINKLRNRRYSVSNPLILEVEITNENSMFDPGWDDHNMKIGFATQPIPLYVIPSIKGDETVKTVKEDTPPDVVLFHELLHFARNLIVKNFIEKIQQEKEIKLFDHPIFADFPGIHSLKTAADERFKEYLGGLDEEDILEGYAGHYCEYYDNSYVSSWTKDVVITETSYNENITIDGKTFKDLTIPEIDFEEVRNIVGGEPEPIRRKFQISHSCSSLGVSNLFLAELEDIIMYDICENGYRLAHNDLCQRGVGENKPLSLRYGHSIMENSIVNTQILEWCVVRAQKCWYAVSKMGG
jgi:hypothetical protein